MPGYVPPPVTVTLALPDLPLAVCVKVTSTGLLVTTSPLILPAASTETCAPLLDGPGACL